MEKSIRLIKLGIWGYFLLLIFEGALRKWFLPGLATPLLIVRDPLVLWVFYLTWKQDLFPRNVYLNGMMILGSVAILTAVLFGHGNAQVAIYGARALTIHFPFLFIMGKVMDHDDVIKMGKVALWIAIPMTLLIAVQFYSPQSAWVNKGLGDDAETAGFSGAMGFFRPPGTFSFTTGNSLFYSFISCFVFYFWLNLHYINRWVLILATIALFVAIPLSISRSLLAQVVLSAVFLVLAVIRNPVYSGKIIIAAVIGVVGLILLGRAEFFQTATEVFSTRIDNASGTEGGLEGTLVDRFFGEMINAFKGSTEQPFFGYGLGMGTNAGSKLLTGERNFLIAEGEWGRVIGEMGLILGLFLLIIRLSFIFKVAIASLKKLGSGDLLPWMLLSFGLLIMAQGGWAQPTALGFYTLIAGLLMASLKDASTNHIVFQLKTKHS